MLPSPRGDEMIHEGRKDNKMFRTLPSPRGDEMIPEYLGGNRIPITLPSPRGDEMIQDWYVHEDQGTYVAVPSRG